MSIQDDYFDLKHFVKGTEMEDALERFGAFAFNLEFRCDNLIKENEQLKTTIKTMMDLKEKM